ncbi:lipopolysaccharide core heptose(II) kinase RfaY, partial [Escherichia sp. WS2312]|uniref:lipopolysaccharide core heptose(II) kinase RfaY n=1 Tax=Escherichia sp. WS2312 TaxID=3381959 RepID=UPI00396F2F40
MSVGSTHHLEMVFVWKQNYILVDEYFFFCCTWIVNSAVSKDGVRIIDLSGKSCTAERKARDRLAMERHLGIANEIKDYGYYSVIYRTKLRKFIKKLKGKA